MAIDFPAAPAIDDQFTSGGVTWRWDGEKWTSVAVLTSGASLPVGSVVMFGGAAAPPDWLICDGSLVSRTAYAALFTAIGVAYGAGDGSTTFALPNANGAFPQGGAPGATGGAANATLTAANLPAHTHVVPAHDHTAAGSQDPHTHTFVSARDAITNYGQQGGTGASGQFIGAPSYIAPAQPNVYVTVNSAGPWTTDGGTGTGAALPILPPFVGFNFIIKAL